MIAVRAFAVSTSVAAGLALSGCGGGSSSGSAGTSGKSSNASLQKFHECLSSHGVKLPEGGAPSGSGEPPSGPGAPPSDKGFTPPKSGFAEGSGPGGSAFEAIKACSKYAPKRGAFPGAGRGEPPSGVFPSEGG